MQLISKFNKILCFLLCAIEILSKYVMLFKKVLDKSNAISRQKMGK